MRFNGTLISAVRPPALKLGLAMCVRIFLLLALLAAVVRPPEIRAQNGGQREYEIKAGYLYNFINYIDWPAEALPPAGGTITLGIVGETPYAAAFDLLNGKQIKGRKLVVKQVASTNDLEQCQIVFICVSEKARLPEYLGQLKDAKLLTVSEIDGFAEQGGVINFISERNKVRFEINPEAARRAGLTISSELLKLAKLVKP
jgi:YfiR/HmsC-like